MAEEDGNESWAVATIVESEEEAALAAGFLQANDIPAEVESLLVSELPTTVGHLAEVRIRVPADRLAEAQALLAEQETAAGQAADAPADDAGEPL